MRNQLYIYFVIKELEDLVEALEGQEKEYIEREQKLREKLRDAETNDTQDKQLVMYQDLQI